MESVKLRGDGFSVLNLLQVGLEAFPLAVYRFGEMLLNSQDVADWLIKANRDNLRAGIRPDGSDITKTPRNGEKSSKYEWSTRLRKEAQGMDGSKVTLYDEGEFYAGLYAIATETSIELDSDDSKRDLLVAKWGNVFGITNEQLIEFVELIYPRFIDFVSTYNFR